VRLFLDFSICARTDRQAVRQTDRRKGRIVEKSRNLKELQYHIPTQYPVFTLSYIVVAYIPFRWTGGMAQASGGT